MIKTNWLSRSLIALTLAGFSVASPAWAKSPSAEDKQITAVLESAKKDLSRYNKTMLSALQSNPKLWTAMKSDAQRIEKIQNVQKRIQAIANYQNKYAGSYRDALAKSGVDLKSLANSLNRKMGKPVFVVEKGTHIIMRPLRQVVHQLPPLPKKTTTTVNVSPQDFDFERDASCILLAGSGIEFEGPLLRNSNWAAVLGGCLQYGAASHSFQGAPRGSTTQVSLSYDMSIPVLLRIFLLLAWAPRQAFVSEIRALRPRVPVTKKN